MPVDKATAVATTAPAAAPSKPAPTVPSPMAPAKDAPTRTVWAVIQSIDSTNQKLVVKDKHDRILTISLMPATSVTKGGDNEPVKLSDLKAGDYLKLTLAGDAATGVHVNVRHPK